MGSFNRGYASSLRGFPLQVGITLCAAWGFTLFGYDQGVLGGLVALPRFLSDNHINPNNASLQGTVVAIYDIGCLVGCILCMFTGQRLGRRIFIVVGGVFLVIGASLQAASNSATFLIAGRVVGGVGMGINTVIVPVWVAETSKSGSRGAQITTQMCLVCIGIVVAFWFDFGMIYHHINSTAVWRAPVAFQIIFIVLSWVTIFFLPESPRYLYANGYIADGDDVMARLYKLAPDSGEVLALRNDVLATLEAAKEHHFRMTDLIYDRSQVNATWRLWMCVLIQLLQQMDGNNIISYYSSYLFIHSLGMSQRHASVTSGGIALLALGGCISAVWTTERFGRRAVMLWGAVALTLFMTLFTIGLGINTDASLKLAVVSIFLFEFSLGASWACVVWVYIPEIAPLNVRHVGAALGTFTSWGVTFIIVKLGPVGITHIGYKFYIIFCVFTAITIPFVYFFVKETKGLSLEEIDLLFAKKDYRPILEEKIRARRYIEGDDELANSEKMASAHCEEQPKSSV